MLINIHIRVISECVLNLENYIPQSDQNYFDETVAKSCYHWQVEPLPLSLPWIRQEIVAGSADPSPLLN